jgi:hypothetical protein
MVLASTLMRAVRKSSSCAASSMPDPAVMPVRMRWRISSALFSACTRPVISKCRPA